MYAVAMAFLGTYLVGFFGLLATMGQAQASLIRRLRERHPDVWERLGEPAPLVGLRRGDRYWMAAKVNRYIRLRGYRSVDDPPLWQAGDRVFALRRAVLRFGFVGAVVVAMVLWASHRYDA